VEFGFLCFIAGVTFEWQYISFRRRCSLWRVWLFKQSDRQWWPAVTRRRPVCVFCSDVLYYYVDPLAVINSQVWHWVELGCRKICIARHHEHISGCHTGPISLCIDSFVFMCLYFVCFCFILL